MVRPERDLLTGEVELDETFIGGVYPRATAAIYTNKTPVMVAVERLSRGRLGQGPNRGRRPPAVGAEAGRLRHPHHRTRLDHPYRRRDRPPTAHQTRLHPPLHHRGPRHRPAGVHLVASLLKRWIAGTLQHNVSAEHLAYYLDEYAFRFNRRNSRARGMLFYRLLQQAVATDPHPLKELYSSG